MVSWWVYIGLLGSIGTCMHLFSNLKNQELKVEGFRVWGLGQGRM